MSTMFGVNELFVHRSSDHLTGWAVVYSIFLQQKLLNVYYQKEDVVFSLCHAVTRLCLRSGMRRGKLRQCRLFRDKCLSSPLYVLSYRGGGQFKYC